MLHQLTNLDDIKTFILGGNCEFVLKNINSGNTLDFQIIKSKVAVDRYNITLKSTHFEYIGCIKTYNNLAKTSLSVYCYPNEKLTDEKLQTASAVMYKLVLFLFNQNKLPEGVEFYHIGRCCKCGRKLTDLNSINSGIGKKCAENE